MVKEMVFYTGIVIGFIFIIYMAWNEEEEDEE